MKEKIFLVGLRGAGKTTVGKMLAGRLGVDFRDQDALVVDRAGKSIRRIFEDEGEEGFRRMETEVLKDLAGEGRAVVATGGGVILREENRRLMRRSGVVLYLHAPPEVLAERVERDPATGEQRPALVGGGGAGEELPALYAARDALYRLAADAVVDATGAPEEVLASVLDALDGRLGRD